MPAFRLVFFSRLGEDIGGIVPIKGQPSVLFFETLLIRTSEAQYRFLPAETYPPNLPSSWSDPAKRETEQTPALRRFLCLPFLVRQSDTWYQKKASIPSCFFNIFGTTIGGTDRLLHDMNYSPNLPSSCTDPAKRATEKRPAFRLVF